MKKLQIGCGDKARKDFVNLDRVKLPGVDVVHNLDKYPWPFKNNEFDYVYADNVLEHLDSIVRPLEEMWRITKPGAKSRIIVPLFPSVWSMNDPTHKQFYSFMTFDVFQESSSLRYYSHARFRIAKRKILFHPLLKIMEAVNLHERLQKFYYVFFSQIIPPMFLDVELETVKKKKD